MGEDPKLQDGTPDPVSPEPATAPVNFQPGGDRVPPTPAPSLSAEPAPLGTTTPAPIEVPMSAPPLDIPVEETLAAQRAYDNETREEPKSYREGATDETEAHRISVGEGIEFTLDDTNVDDRPPLAVGQLTPAEAAEVPAVKSSRDYNKIAMIVGAVVAVVLLIGLAVMFLRSSGGDSEPTNTDDSKQAKARLLGVTPVLVDGEAWLRSDSEAEWQQMTVDSELKEGYAVRTEPASRMVIAFDDGSVLRLDSNSSVVLTSLANDSVQIEQTSGVVYSRVVASSRTYTVVAGGNSYEALGTAFSTVENESESGVQVYQSSVKVDDKTIGEGKRYYTKSPSTTLSGQVTDLNIDELVADSFIEWCLSEDEKNAEFKNELGTLARVKQRSAEMAEEERLEKERLEKEQAEAAEKAAAQKQAEEAAKKEKEQKDAEDKNKQNSGKKVVARGTLSLSASGNKLSWSFTGVAPYGYKVLVSNSNKPTFPKHSVEHTTSTSATVSLNDMVKGTNFVRVCAYTGGTESEPCVNYSNEVTVTKN